MISILSTNSPLNNLPTTCLLLWSWMLVASAHVTQINTLSRKSPHNNLPTLYPLLRSCDCGWFETQHILNIFTSLSPLRKCGGGLHVGCLCIKYWQHVGIMLSLPQILPTFSRVPHKLNSTKCSFYCYTFSAHCLFDVLWLYTQRVSIPVDTACRSSSEKMTDASPRARCLDVAVDLSGSPMPNVDSQRETHNKNKFDAGHIVKLSRVHMPRQIRTISWQTSLDTGFTPTLVQCLLFMLPLTSAIRKMHFPVTAGEARKKEDMLSYLEAQKKY